MSPSVPGPVAALLALALLAFAPLPAKADPVAIGSEHCVVNVRGDDRLNLREAPDRRSEVLSELRYAQCGVLVTGECRGD